MVAKKIIEHLSPLCTNGKIYQKNKYNYGVVQANKLDPSLKWKPQTLKITWFTITLPKIYKPFDNPIVIDDEPIDMNTNYRKLFFKDNNFYMNILKVEDITSEGHQFKLVLI